MQRQAGGSRRRCGFSRAGRGLGCGFVNFAPQKDFKSNYGKFFWGITFPPPFSIDAIRQSPPPPGNMAPRAGQRSPAETGTDRPPNPNRVPPGSAKTHRSHLNARPLHRDTPRGRPGSRHGAPSEDVPHRRAPPGWQSPPCRCVSRLFHHEASKEKLPPTPLRGLPRPSALSAPSARARLISQITSRKAPRPLLPSDLPGPSRLSAPQLMLQNPRYPGEILISRARRRSGDAVGAGVKASGCKSPPGDGGSGYPGVP